MLVFFLDLIHIPAKTTEKAIDSLTDKIKAMIETIENGKNTKALKTMPIS